MINLVLLLTTVLILAACCILSHGKWKNDIKREIQTLKDETIRRLRR